MPVCAPVRVRVCEEIVDENNSDNLELKRKLMKVVNTGHSEVLQGKTVEAGVYPKVCVNSKKLA